MPPTSSCLGGEALLLLSPKDGPASYPAFPQSAGDCPQGGRSGCNQVITSEKIGLTWNGLGPLGGRPVANKQSPLTEFHLTTNLLGAASAGEPWARGPAERSAGI